MKVEISFPKSAKLAFTPPKKLAFGDVVFKFAKKSRIVLNISHELKIEPEKIYNCLKKLIGETVKKDEVLAEKKGLLSKKVFKSPFSGKVVEINHFTGTLTLETEEPNFFEKFKEMEGEVLEKKGNKLIVNLKEPTILKLKKTNLLNILGGKVSKIKTGEEFTKTMVENKIILIEKTSEYIESKLLALKAKGIISLYPPKRRDLAFAQITKVNDFKLAYQQEKKYVLIDPFQNMLYIYN